MSRLIDADVLHSALNKMQKWVVVKDNYHNEGYSYDQVHFAIDNAPTIDAEPIRHGYWLYDRLCSTNGGTYGVQRCSNCGYYYKDFGDEWNYCPHCGAKMDEVIENENSCRDE